MGKTRSSLVVIVFGGAVNLVRLLGNLFVIWLTLGWKVWRARRAFERELVRKGMSKDDAKRLSAKYAALKDDAMNAFKQSWRFWS